jgi:GT2 family glycosyltransferase
VLGNIEKGKIAVVIATHKMVPQLEAVLGRFQDIVKDPKDLIFVDNGSPERLHGTVKSTFPQIKIISLPWNKYFCGGYNAGIQAAMTAGYEFVLLVNADTDLNNMNLISQLINTARRWPKAAFIGPLVFYRSRYVAQRTCLRFPNLFYHVAIWLPWRLGGKFIMGQNLKERAVEYLNGVCVLCRIEALREIGLMDELFCGYYEDADWAYRAREKGWSSIFTPVPSVIHHESENGYEMYALKSFLQKRNAVYWFLKTGRNKSAWIYAKISIVLAKIRFLLTRNGEEKKKHLFFLEELKKSYRVMLIDGKLSKCFGPPLAPWEGE